MHTRLRFLLIAGSGLFKAGTSVFRSACSRLESATGSGSASLLHRFIHPIRFQTGFSQEYAQRDRPPPVMVSPERYAFLVKSGS